MTYLGPLGGLTRIHPLTEIETTSTREGGAHTPLSGRKIVDYLGNRAQFKMKFRRQTSDEMAFLEALHHRHIRGPLRLVLDGLKRNRLSRSAASVGFAGRDMHGVTLTEGSSDVSALWPSGLALPGQSLRWIGWGASGAIRLDRDAPAPVLPTDTTLTASLYVRSPNADEVLLGMNHWDASQGAYNGSPTSGNQVALTPDTWTRLTVTATESELADGASPSLQVMVQATSEAELFIAAPQLESGDVATDWQLGGAAPLVSVDQMSTSSPYVPLTIPELTLMEL